MILRTIILVGLLSLIGFLCSTNPPPTRTADPTHWQKLSASGTAINQWAGPWSCVLDKRNQLVWEVKSDDESIHDGYWTYSWFNQTVGVQNFGDCYFEKDRCDTLDLIRRVNQKKLCGLTHWRLPTEVELKSLLIKNPRPGSALIAKEFFPFTQRGDYWTSAHETELEGTYQYLKYGAVAINFASGQRVNIPYRNAAFVRLVTEAPTK